MTATACIFCRIDRPVVVQSAHSLAIFDNFPVAKGHTLVVPRRHVVTIWELDDAEFADAFLLVRKVKQLLEKEFAPDGFNVGVNCGEAAGQSVWHAHIHIIPRYRGDVPRPRGGVRNIMPEKGAY